MPRTAATDLLVHPIAPEEVPAWSRAMATPFLRDPASAEADRHIEGLTRIWDPSRAWGAREGGRWVATLRSDPRRLTVPGLGSDTRELDVDALTNVTVAATHRRRGLMSAMLSASLRAARERGDALSILIAAEWPIYGRFGYAPAVWSADYVLRGPLAGGVRGGDPGRVRQVERDEFAEVAGSVFADFRRERPGHVDRSEVWWDRLLGRDGYTASEGLPHNWLVHEGESGSDGLLGWKAGGQWSLIPPYGQHIEVWELASVGEAAYRDLWAYLAGIDLVEEVRLSNRPVDEPVRWLLGDGRALVTSRLVDLVWVRLLDVAAALRARRYPVAGEVVLEVIDEDGDRFAAGRYRLTVDDDRVECETEPHAPPDLELTQRALASVYLGGVGLAELALVGAARELRPGALGRAAAMFATPLAPWNATWF